MAGTVQYVGSHTTSSFSLLGGHVPPPPTPRERLREKAAADQRGIIRPQFLPYYSDVTGETPAMRRAYRVMLADPNIKPALLGKILAVAALEANFNPGEETDHGKRLAEFCQWQFTERVCGGVPEIVWNVFSGGLIDGYSVNERVWAVEDTHQWGQRHVLTALKPKQVDDDVVLLTDEFRNVVGVQGQRYNTGEVWHPSDFVIWRNPGLYGVATGMSDLRAAYGRYWVLDTATKLRAIGAEKRAFPVVVGHYSDDSDKAGLEAALENVKSSNWLSAPETSRIEAINIAGSGDSYFRDLTKDLREEIVLAIAGALLQMLQGGEGVQRGASKVHKDTADLFKWWLQQSITTVFNDHETGLIRCVIDPNFAGVRRYPRASFGGVDEAELAESLGIDEGLQRLGWKHSRKALERTYGRAWATDQADEVTPAPATPAMPFSEPDAGPEVPVLEPFRFSEQWHADEFAWTES